MKILLLNVIAFLSFLWSDCDKKEYVLYNVMYIESFQKMFKYDRKSVSNTCMLQRKSIYFLIHTCYLIESKHLNAQLLPLIALQWGVNIPRKVLSDIR